MKRKDFDMKHKKHETAEDASADSRTSPALENTTVVKKLLRSLWREWEVLIGKRPVSHKEHSFFTLFFFSLIGIVLVVAIAGFLVFSMTLRGMETVVVPDVEGSHVVDAIVRLQEQGVAAYVAARYHHDSSLKNHVLDQDPPAGAVVRLGKRIQLVVSRGTIVDVVRDYVGRRLDEVQLEVQQTFSAYDDLISIGNVSYVFSPEEPGTILEQDPPAETPVSDAIALNLLVSRGIEPQKNVMDRYTGMDFETVLQRVSRLGMQFQFALSEEDSDTQGVVVAQSPEPDQALLAGRVIRLIISPVTPPQDDDLIFGLLPIGLDYYEAPVTIQVNAEMPNQLPRVLMQTTYLGGALTIPFLEPEGTILVVYRNKEAILQHVVIATVNPSS